MENASKAVLIAGSVIIAIAIISIAVVVYMNVNSAMNNISIDSTAIATHNSRFASYLGNVTGSQVKICISNALANNYNQNTMPEYKIEVSIVDAGNTFDYIKYNDANKVGSGKQTICDQISNNIKANYLYKGSLTYNEQGIITKIQFTKQ